MPLVEFVFFDHGGTLTSLPKEVHEPAWEVLQEAGYRCSLEAVKSAYEEAERRWRERHPVRGRRWNKEIASELYQTLLEKLGIPDRYDLAEKTYHEWHDRAGIKLFPDTVPCLEELRSRGLRMGVITQTILSAEQYAFNHLKRFDLEQYFSIILTSEDGGYDKPDPRLFQRALELSSSSPPQTVHIGDTYEFDVMGARSAGMRAILLDRNRRQEGVDCDKISSLTELPRIMA